MKVKFLLSGTMVLCMLAFGPYSNAMFGAGGGNNNIPKPDIPPYVLEYVFRKGFNTNEKAQTYSNKMKREGLLCIVSPPTPVKNGANVPPPFICNVYVEQRPSK